MRQLARLIPNPHLSGSESDHGNAERPGAEGGEGGSGNPSGAVGRAQRGGHISQEAGRIGFCTAQGGEKGT